jgi:hypothetical protein
LIIYGHADNYTNEPETVPVRVISFQMCAAQKLKLICLSFVSYACPALIMPTVTLNTPIAIG